MEFFRHPHPSSSNLCHRIRINKKRLGDFPLCNSRAFPLVNIVRIEHIGQNSQCGLDLLGQCLLWCLHGPPVSGCWSVRSSCVEQTTAGCFKPDHTLSQKSDFRFRWPVLNRARFLGGCLRLYKKKKKKKFWARLVGKSSQIRVKTSA